MAQVEPSAVLHDRIRGQIAEIRTSIVRTRARVIAALGVAIALFLLVVVGTSEAVYHRIAAGLDIDPAHAAQLQWSAALLLLLTLIATVMALWRGKSGFGAGVSGLTMVAVLMAPVYAALTILLPVHADSVQPAEVAISPWGTRCALIAGVVGFGVLACFTAALRRAVPVASTLRSAALGAAAGSWAGFAVFAFCPSGDRLHLLVGHVLPVIVLIVVGALASPRQLRP
jgi:hypothetical protein